MATLLNADPPSDEEDDDYEPTKAELEAADEARSASAPAAKRKLLHRGVPGPTPVSQAEFSGRSEVAEEEDQEIVDPKAAVKKARVDSLWAQLNQGKQPSSSSSAKPIPKNLSLAALCKPLKKTKQRADDRSWMKQLGLVPKKVSPAGGNPQAVDMSAVAAAALTAAQSAVSATAAQQHGKVAVMETRRFAGTDIQVEKTVTAEDAKKAEQQKKAVGGLDAMLQSLKDPKKVNVLDKSRQDWSGFKKEHTAVEEELEVYKKSGDKYLDKVDFLQRADVRQYEKERDERLAQDVRNRGRL